MTRKLFALGAVLACGLVPAGCGDDDDDNKDSGGSNPPAAQTESGSGGSGGSGADNPNAKQAVESCKQSVNQSAQLSADVKKKLEGICEDAASGDEQAVRKAAKEVCTTVAKESVPAGASRDQAVKACEQAGAGR